MRRKKERLGMVTR